MKPPKPEIAIRATQNHVASVAMVMGGVAGAAPTTVGERSADRLNREFAEKDRLHLPEKVAKMRSGGR